MTRFPSILLAVLLLAGSAHGQVFQSQLFPGLWGQRPPQYCPPEGCPTPLPIQSPPQSYQQFQQPPHQYAEQPPMAPVAPRPAVHVKLPDEVKGAVVRIANKDRDGQAQSLCTGTVIETSQSGSVVLTCAHLMDHKSGDDFAVYFPDGQESPGTLIGTDRGLDLSAIWIPVKSARVLSVSDAPPAIGERLYAAGYGKVGAVAAIQGQTTQYVQVGGTPIDGAFEMTGGVRSGDSGGPVLNQQYEVVGVITCSNGADADVRTYPDGSTNTVKINRKIETPGEITIATTCHQVRGFLSRFREKIRQLFGRAKPQQPQLAQKAQPTVQLPPAAYAPPGSLVVVPGPETYTPPQTNPTLPPITAGNGRATEAPPFDSTASGSPRTAGPGAQNGGESEAPLFNPSAPQSPSVSGPPVIPQPVKSGIESAVGGLAAAGATALGLSGPAGMIASLVSVWMVRRIGKRIDEKLSQPRGGETSAGGITQVIRTITEPATPQPLAIDERHHNHFVEVPDSREAKAWAHATRVWGDRFPGSQNTLKGIERLKDQILSGQPTSIPT